MQAGGGDGDASRRHRDSVCAEARASLDAGQVAEALEVLRLADPSAEEDPAVLSLFAEASRRRGHLLSALRAYDRLVELDAASADNWLAMADTLADVGEHAQAVGAYRETLKREPMHPAARHNLGRAFYRLGRVDEARVHIEESVKHSDSPRAWVSLGTIIPACPGATPGDILRCRTAVGARLRREAEGLPRMQSRGRMSRSALRVGYLGASFDRPNYMKPVWALINHHDRGLVQVHLLSDATTSSFDGYHPHRLDQVHDVRALDNRALRELVASLGIDILVDLNGYSVPERLAMFVEPPAPVTLAWFNMYATSGLPGIHALLGDATVYRPNEASFFSESVLTLPLSYLTFEVGYAVPDPVPPPCCGGAPLTFGSLASQYKLTEPVVDAWAEILRAAPDVRLLLANTALRSPCNRDDLAARFEERGICRERLILLEPADHQHFLRYYEKIDIALDTFPYNGGTTTMEALWQGVPVLTFSGDRWVARTSASIIGAGGCDQMIAPTERDLVDLAVRWAQDPDTPARLARLRQTMRTQLAQSKACAGTELARAMEAAYRECWKRAERP